MSIFGDIFGVGPGSGSLTAPTIENITPDVNATPGTPGAFSAVFSIARATPIEFDLTDIPPDSAIVIYMKFADRDETYIALDVDGEWLWPFDVGSSITSLEVDPTHVVLLPRGGWRSGTVEFTVIAATEAANAVGDEGGLDGGLDMVLVS